MNVNIRLSRLQGPGCALRRAEPIQFWADIAAVKDLLSSMFCAKRLKPPAEVHQAIAGKIASQPSLEPEIECICIPLPSGPHTPPSALLQAPWLCVECVLPHRPSLDTALLYRDVFICMRLWRIMEGVSKRPPVVPQHQSLVLTIESASRYLAEVLLLLTIIIATLIHSLRVLTEGMRN